MASTNKPSMQLTGSIQSPTLTATKLAMEQKATNHNFPSESFFCAGEVFILSSIEIIRTIDSKSTPTTASHQIIYIAMR